MKWLLISLLYISTNVGESVDYSIDYSINLTSSVNMITSESNAKSVLGVVGTVLCAPSVTDVLGKCGSEMKVVLDALKGFPMDNLFCCLFAKFRICLRQNTQEDCAGNSFVGQLFGPTFGEQASQQIDETMTGLTQDLDILAEMCYDYVPTSGECNFIIFILLNFYTVIGTTLIVFGSFFIIYFITLGCALTGRKNMTKVKDFK